MSEIPNTNGQGKREEYAYDTAPVYQRKRGIQYVIVNKHTKPDGNGGVIMNQGILAKFKPQSDTLQMGEFDVKKYIDGWIQNEVVSGRLDYDDESIEKKKNEMAKRICTFIERHPDWQSNEIWRKPTKQEIAAQMRKSIEEQKKAIEELEAEVEVPESMSDKVIDEVVEKKVQMNPREAELVKGGGVRPGGATTANVRNG